MIQQERYKSAWNRMRSRPVIMRLALLTLAALLLNGCLAYRLTEFTDQTRRADQLSDEELRRLQFHTSHTLVLTAMNEVRESPTPGWLKKPRLDTRYVDQVLIRRRTRGVVVAAGDRWLDVSFHEGTWLRFNRMPSGRYLLDASTVMYGDQQYRVECVPRRFSECPVSLLIRKNLKREIRVRSQKVEGRRP